MTHGQVKLEDRGDGPGGQRHGWTGLLFGLLAGSTLSVFAWGLDGLLLARADGLFPWAKTLLGAGCILVPLGLIGWLSLRVRHAIISAVLWLMAGASFGWLAAQIAFRLHPWVLAWLVPEAERFIEYEWGYGPSARATLCSLFCGLILFMAGLMSHDLMEGWSKGLYPVSRAFSIVLWVGFFALSGMIADYLINQPLRVPVTVLDELVSFRLSHPAWRDMPQAKLLHASVLNPADALLPRRHRLAVAGFDEIVSTVRVLVDFEGTWIECTLIGAEPVFCRLLE